MSMKVTKDILEKRIDELVKEREEYLCRANSCNGAIGALEFVLDVLEQPEGPVSTSVGNKTRLAGNRIETADPSSVKLPFPIHVSTPHPPADQVLAGPAECEEENEDE